MAATGKLGERKSATGHAAFEPGGKTASIARDGDFDRLCKGSRSHGATGSLALILPGASTAA
jgi:hypothetical protein